MGGQVWAANEEKGDVGRRGKVRFVCGVWFEEIGLGVGGKVNREAESCRSGEVMNWRGVVCRRGEVVRW